MMFNIQLQVANATVVEADGHLDLQLVVGLGIPQEDGMAMLPAGIVSIPIGKQMGVNLGQDLKEKAEALPDPPKPSDIVIPKNPGEVAKAATAEQ